METTMTGQERWRLTKKLRIVYGCVFIILAGAVVLSKRPYVPDYVMWACAFFVYGFLFLVSRSSRVFLIGSAALLIAWIIACILLGSYGILITLSLCGMVILSVWIFDKIRQNRELDN